jgi:hypothetical protein
MAVADGRTGAPGWELRFSEGSAPTVADQQAPNPAVESWQKAGVIEKVLNGDPLPLGQSDLDP